MPIAGENRNLEQMHIPRLFRRMFAKCRQTRIDTWRSSGKRHLQPGEPLEQRTLLTANSMLTEALLPLSTETGQISGTLYSDQDANGVQSSSETGLSGWRVFLDDNRNGSHDTGEVVTTTDSTGSYAFTNLPVGQHVLSVEVSSGWEVTSDHASVSTQDGALARLATTEQNDPPNSTRNLFSKEHRADQLIVCLTDSARADEKIMDAVREKQQMHGHQTLNQMQNGLELWRVDSLLTDAYEIWANDPRIALIEPNYTFSVADTFPDDDRIGNLWGLHNTGQNGGSLDADIDAPEAWDLQTGSGEIVIGVIDSGIDYTHPDLANNIWTNPGEIPGNGIDDDENGYIDDVHGWDFVNDDPDPMDGNGHGTHVAGTIAAAGNNEIGISGVSWNASLMALRFLNDSGNGSSYHALLALEYATMMGADITNNSWIGESYSGAAQFAINQAGNAGSLYVVCAGNDRNDNDITPTYPASYLGDNVITVAATTNTDGLSSFSNYGANSVDLGAPGSGILSTKPGGGYTTKSGTSMAAPHVTGVASLLLSKRGDLTPAEIRSAILSGTDSIPSLQGKTVSEGRLNAFGALMQIAPVNGQFVNVYESTNALTQFGIASSSNTLHQFSKIINDGESGFSQSGFTSQSNQQVAEAFNGDNHNLRGGTGTASWTFTDLEDGEYRVAATWAHKYENIYNTIDAPYTIADGSGELASVVVDQSENPKEFNADGAAWDSLATVNVTGGQLTVNLGAGSNSNRYTVADAIRIDGTLTPALTVTLSHSTIRETPGGASVIATVQRTQSAGDLEIHISTDDLTEATAPDLIIIPDGSLIASFELAILDDFEADGNQSVSITVGANGYLSDTVTLTVTDDENNLVLIIDDGESGFSQSGFTSQSNQQVAAAFNGDNHILRGGTGTASWTFTNLEDGEYRVAATWAHKYENIYNTIDAPYTIADGSGELASVVVDQSENPKEFNADGAAWDSLATVNVTGGQLTVNLGAGSNSNRYTVADAIRIEATANVLPLLALQIDPSTVSENQGTLSVTVLRGSTIGNLNVNITTNDFTEINLPDSVFIPDGANEVTFEVTGIDDAIVDGTQIVSITASASGYRAATTELEVTDDDSIFSSIIDDGDQGFNQSGYTSQSNSQVAAAFDGDNHILRGNDGIATWTFTGLADGEYQIAATWAHRYENQYNATDAPFTIIDASGEPLAQAIIDQTNTPNDFIRSDIAWENLATVNITGGSLVISLGPGTNPNQYSVADAIRIERVSSTTGELQIIDAIFEDYEN